MTSENIRLIQKKVELMGASIAPGINIIMLLSTISITVIDAVSAASAIFKLVMKQYPRRRKGMVVSAKPDIKARVTASTIVCTLLHPKRYQ